MNATRRQIMRMGGGLVAALSLAPVIVPMAVRAADIVDITMTGKPDGSDVWFDPIGIRVEVGQTIRWSNRDKGNSHTSTAYHPANFERARRIPRAAKAWDSDYLLPDQSFSIVLTVPGVYDYYCVPHEHAGMVGRIIVKEPRLHDWKGGGKPDAGLPAVALAAFPSVEEIMAKGVVRRA